MLLNDVLSVLNINVEMKINNRNKIDNRNGGDGMHNQIRK